MSGGGGSAEYLRTVVNFARNRSSMSARTGAGTLRTTSSREGRFSPTTGTAPRASDGFRASPRAAASDRNEDSSESSGQSTSLSESETWGFPS